MWKSICGILAVAMLFGNTVDAASKDVTAKVPGGKIQGYIDSNGVKTFKGIPYADSVAGKNRWRAPQPVRKWKGTLDCSKFGQIAVQNEAKNPDYFMPWTDEYLDLGMNLENGLMGENCLSVNIWTTANRGDNKPVIVYIHGGANVSGSADNDVYTGDDIALQDVVYVSMNYRVGIFGFLAYKDSTGEEVRGNFALQDQIAALKWIKENIEKFGGNPQNITIMGQSAGSINVQSLIASPAAKGLFHRAIYLSFNGYQSPDEPTVTTISEAESEAQEKIGNYSISDLRKMSPQDVLNLGYNPHIAVIDGETVAMSVKDAYDSGNFNRVDILCGGVPGDPYLFNSVIDVGNFIEPKMSMTVEEFNSLLPDPKIAELYPISGDAIDAAKSVNNDYLIASYFYAAKMKDSRDSFGKSYVYFFDHVIPDTPERMEKFGAFHTSDVNYWLNHYTTKYPRDWQPIDYTIGKVMSSYIVNFAKTGNPNGKDSFGEDLPQWDEVGKSNGISFMHIGDQIQFETMNPEKSRFWMNYVASH